MKALSPKLLIVAGSLMVAGFASAAVYKYIDENGNVAYGDKPVSGSEKVKIQKAKRPKPEVQNEEEESDQQPQSNRNGGSRQSGGETPSVVYKSLEILTPKNEKIIDDRTGTVQVIFLPTPSLGPTDQLVITVDGKDVSKGRDANLALQQVARGQHTVTGRILDSDDKLKIQANTVTFHVRRPSVNSLALDDNN